VASLLANSAATLLARLAVPAFSFAISVTIARLYGAETLGVYVQLMALTVIFQTAASAGIPLLLTRDIAADGESAPVHLARAGSFALASGTAASAAFLLYAWLGLDGRPALAAAVLAATMIPSARMAIQEGFFMATRTHHRVTAVALVENSLKLVLAGVAFVAGKGIVAICAAIAAARIVAARVGGRLMARQGAALGWSLKWPDALAFARVVAPFAVLLGVSMLYFRVDVLLVGRLRDPAETGLYGAAITLYTVSLLLISSLMSAVYPRLASAFRASQEGFVRSTALTVKLLAVGSVPLAVVMICTAEWALVLVFGEAYRDAARVLQLLAASLPLHAVNGALGQALQAGRHQAVMVRVVIAGLATHVLGILLLVPRLGIDGAAVSMLVSSAIVTSGSALGFDRRVAGLRPGWREAGAVVAVVVPITLTLLAPAPWLVPVGVAALTALAIGVAAGVVSRPELEQLRRVLRLRDGAAVP
jgi:O-antigen/teichoic acid export membrane protein